MAYYKFVGELYFDAADMDDAHTKLAEHFQKLSRHEVSHLLQVGSTSAIGEPELDVSLSEIRVVDFGAESNVG